MVVGPVGRRRRREQGRRGRGLLVQRRLEVGQTRVELGALAGVVAGRGEEAEVSGCGARVLVSVGRCRRCLMRLCLARLHQGVEVEFVGVPLPVDLGHDVLVVVVPATTGEKLFTNGALDIVLKLEIRSRPFVRASSIKNSFLCEKSNSHGDLANQ